MNNIGRIRYDKTGDDTIWWFGVTTRLRTGNGVHSALKIKARLDECPDSMTPEAFAAVNEIFGMDGTKTVWVGDFDLSIEREKVPEWIEVAPNWRSRQSTWSADAINGTADILDRIFFGGTADSSLEYSDGSGQIGDFIWYRQLEDSQTVRQYSLRGGYRFKLSEPEPLGGGRMNFFCTEHDQAPEGEVEGNLTSDARLLMKELFAMTGILSVRITVDKIQIKIARVFAWSDFHELVVNLILRHIIAIENV